MNTLYPRHSFTPQRSPSKPSSQVSHSPPVSEGEAERALNEKWKNDDNGKKRQKHNESDGRHTSSVGGSHQFNAFSCWTAHQSHGQITMLFYVPRWTKKEDLRIVFGRDYVIAGLKEGKEMVIQARLAGRINTTTSTWQLERKSNKRSRSRSGSRSGRNRLRNKGTDTAASNPSSGESSSAKGKRKIASSKGDEVATIERTASPASSSETSSFDILARSTDTLESGSGWDSNWNNVAERLSSPHLARQASQTGDSATSPLGSSPRLLQQSTTFSEEGSGYLPSAGSNSGGEGVRSLESSISIDPSQHSSPSQPLSEDDIITDAKLVTLHLDKVDVGIWPFMVSGPASLSLLPPSRAAASSPFILSSQHQSLDAALEEALSNPHHHHHTNNNSPPLTQGPAIPEEEEGEGEGEETDDSFTHSTVTIDTVASDDSTTVLGVERPGGKEEELYEMDPTSLALMGMRHTRQGHRTPFASATNREESRAFEYFRRAWRRAEIPLATKRLVEDYLPLPIYQNNAIVLAFQIRLMAALGGPTALARLYVSYARLQLPSSLDKRSPLAFPLGGLTNPFGSGPQNDQLSSPRSQADLSTKNDAILYLREACTLDKNVVISDEEWQEAHLLDDEGEAAKGGGMQSETGRAASSKWTGSEKIDEQRGKKTLAKKHKGDKGKRKKAMSGSSKRDLNNHSNSNSTSRGSEKFSSDQGLVFVLVSRAALLSVMVAGGVAVARWWSRTAASGVGGG
ncbi:hypothetical protein CBS101457_001853 [Exobasidium rhododendri]|nr:hypothetical protein CBS101457_001853 [Exobasidium rhododendri]